MFAQPVQCTMLNAQKFADQSNIRMTRSQCYWEEAVMTTSFEGVGVQFVFDTMTAHIVRLM